MKILQDVRGAITALVLALFVLGVSGCATQPSPVAQHWALGEWSGKIGNDTWYLEIREVKPDEFASAGYSRKTPVTSNRGKVMVRGDDVQYEFTDGASLKLTRKGSELPGIFRTKEGRDSTLLFKQEPNDTVYFGTLRLQGCLGLSELATVIINGSTVRGTSYAPGYIGPVFQGEMNGDQYSEFVNAVRSDGSKGSQFKIDLKRDGNKVGLRVNGAESNNIRTCSLYGTLMQVVRPTSPAQSAEGR